MNWPLWALVAGLVVTVAVLVRALIGDRSRGRRRCPSCWYDMGGTTGLVCPECGNDARRETRLHKARRRKRWIAASIVPVVAGTVVYGAWLARQPDWFKRAPGVVLVAASPWQAQRDPGGGELLRRLRPRKEYSLAGWERWVLGHISHRVVHSSASSEAVVFHAFLLIVMNKDDETTAATLLRLLTDPDTHVVRRAALLLKDTGRSEQVEIALVRLTEHADPEVRKTAVLSLGFFKEEQPGGRPPELLYLYAANVADPYARGLACWVLGLFDPNERSRELLLGAVESTSAEPRVCEKATASLTRHYPDDPRVRELLLRALREPGRVEDLSLFIESVVEADRWFDDGAGEISSARRALYSREVREAMVAAVGDRSLDPLLWDKSRYLLQKAPWLTEAERERVPPPVTPEAELVR